MIQAELISLYLSKIRCGVKISFSRLFSVYFVQPGDLIGGAQQVCYSPRVNSISRTFRAQIGNSFACNRVILL